MSVRNYPGGPSGGAYAKNNGVDASTVGDKVSYTCPAGFQAKVLGMWAALLVNAPTLQMKLTIGGQSIVVKQAAVDFELTGQPILLAGDSARLSVITAVAGATFTGCICVEEYSAT